MMKKYIPFLLLFIFADCTNKVKCTKNIAIKSNIDEPKVIWISVYYPDTTYQCLNQKNGLPARQEIDISYGQPSKSCWESALEDKSLQVFIVDSAIYQDSTCDVIRAHHELYKRMEFTIDQLNQLKWQIDINE